ncbi:MAG: archaellin/type IV pilin N-terminal domain-containing protein [Candidatus Nanohaloarchaea archaeon]|nr:archaellin/type IV pilin N-terminal domain-containing protein [Candidatus Nanohaloarchaea archaeon]
MIYNSSRKGVSPLIAAVLLIAFTMAVAAILTAWVTTFTQEQTSQLGNQSAQQIDCNFGQIDVFSRESSTRWVNISLENSGRVDLTNISVTAVAGGSVLGTEYIGNLSSGQIDDAAVFTDGTDPDEVRAASKECPRVSVSQTLS